MGCQHQNGELFLKVVRFFLCFPIAFKFLEKAVKGQKAGGNFSEIFLSEVRVKASLTGGQFFDTDTHE